MASRARTLLHVAVGACLMIASVSSASARTRKPLRSRLLEVNGISIHCLDSGGSRPALLFIPGLGDTAWMMEGFASRFSDTNRVIIMTRRGYGRSSMPRDGYDLATRVEDIRSLLDALNVPRAVLVGHSIAGDELTAFACSYPHRVASLIYLDAAYDRSDPETPQPTSAVWNKVLLAWLGNEQRARASLARTRALQRRTYFGVWTASQERNLRETTIVNVDGTVSSRTPSWVGRAIGDADKTTKLSLPSVTVPALLLFARQRLERRLALDSKTRAGLIADEDAYEAYFSRYLAELEEHPNLRIVVMKQTMHHLYLEKPAEVQRLMRRFLSETRRKEPTQGPLRPAN